MRKVNKEDVRKTDWVEAQNFSFKITPRVTSSRNNRRIGRESAILQAGKDQKHGRKSLKVNGIDILNNSINSPPVSFRTRRQSMAVFPKIEIVNRPKNQISRSKSEKVISKGALSKEKLPIVSTSKKLPSEHDPEQLSKLINHRVKSPSKQSNTKLTRSKPLIQSLNCTKKKSDNKADCTATAKMQRNKGSAHLADINNKNLLIKKVAIKKPLKRLAASATPVKSPLYCNKRLTRSAKKRVKIVAKSPVPIKENFKKTPISNKRLRPSASHKDSPVFAQTSGSKLTSINKKQKDFLNTPFTPKPEEPSNIIKQSMRKKIAINLEAVTDHQLLIAMKTPQKEIGNSIKVLTSTPASVSNLTLTPKSSQKSSLRRIRIRSPYVENNIEEHANASISSLSEKMPSNSTPMRNGTNQADPILNKSIPPHPSMATDIQDSFSESLSDDEITDVEEMEPDTPPSEKSTKSYCLLM